MKSAIVKKIILALVVVMSSTIVWAEEEIVSSCTSEQIQIDTESCTNATTTITLDDISTVVKVAYSARAWATAITMRSCSLYDNGAFVASFDDEGVFNWVPTSYGVHILSLVIDGYGILQSRYVLDYPEDFAVECSAEKISIDTRAGVEILSAKEIEKIVWSGLWTADANTDVSVFMNGSLFVSGRGEGLSEWTPLRAGIYEFRHITEGSDETLSATFNVEAKDVAQALVMVDCGDVTYTGAAFMPEIQSVVHEGKQLVEGIDYLLVYSSNTEVGTATITLTGINLFTGTYTTNFTIKPKMLATVMVGNVEDVVYSGLTYKPEPMVRDLERCITLERGIDYTLVWGMNTEAGHASVTVIGKGNYTGTITKSFTIAKAEVEVPTLSEKAYTGELLKSDILATAYYTVQDEGGVDVGNYPVILTLTDSMNYHWKEGDSAQLELMFSITKAVNTWIREPIITGWKFGDTPNDPDMGEVKFGTVAVTYGLNGVRRPERAGDYVATFMVEGTDNYIGLTLYSSVDVA